MFISEFATHLGIEGRIKKKTFIYSFISPCWVLVATCWIFHCNAGLSSCRGVCSVIQLCLTLCNPMDCSTPGFLSFTISWNLLKLMSIELVMPSNYLASVIPFSSCLQYFPASGSFPVSWLLASGGQSIGASASASVLPMNILG